MANPQLPTTLIYKKFSKLAAIRRAESHDDFYQGSWRAKIKKVISVSHDANGRAISAVVKTPSGGSVTVPLNGTASSNKTVRQIQLDIAEMDKWFNDNLVAAQNLQTGDAFNVLYKKDETRGICGASVGTGTVPYTSYQDVLDNFSTQTKVVNVDAELADLVFQNGFQMSRFLFDLRELIANDYVKENYSTYHFASAAVAGLCKVNQLGHLVSYDEVRADINAKANGGFAASDVAVLGRHYGFKADGVTPEPTERDVSGGLKYKYAGFDYIYRQHYAVNNSQPLTASNINDPQTGKQLYQYTDVGDESRRAQFLSDLQALETTSAGQANSGKPGTYFRWKNDWVMQKISGYIIANAPAKGILPAPFTNSYYGSTFVDTNDNNSNLCGFGLVKSAPETIKFRIIGTVGGSANSSGIPNFTTKEFVTRVAINTLDPAHLPTAENNVSLFLHEGALGHGFDNVPNYIDLFRGNSNTISWLSTFNNSGGFTTEGQIWTYPLLGPGAGTLFEGWATFGEVKGVVKRLDLKFDAQGCPIPDAVNTVGAFTGIVQLARIGGRQVIAVAENYSKYAWSFYHSVAEFTRLTDIPVADGVDYHMRFIGHPTQQTEYASGLVTNLGLLSSIKETAVARGCQVNEAAFNQFRITRTDYILGATLQKVVDDNIDLFLICP